MSDFDSIDFFTDQSIIRDPNPYLDHMRSKCPVLVEPHHGVVAVTGHDEALAVYRDTENFSSCNAVGGPFPDLPFTPEGDDISDLIAKHRPEMIMHEHMVTMDNPEHKLSRGLLNRLFTPRRVKENEEFMWRLADTQLDEFVKSGSTEILKDYAKPFALLVIADLLGVPEEDHDEFRIRLGSPRPGAVVGALDKDVLDQNPLEWLDSKFSQYIEDRRKEPRGDVLTALAEAKYPDGSTPEVIDVVRSATFVFAAGQETTVKLLSAGLKFLAEDPELQQRIRDDRELIGNFIEEVLRMEGPVKSTFRLAKKTTTVGDLEVKAGTTVMLCVGAINRDPSRFEDPHHLDLERHNVKEQMAFGRGIHSCPGGPLAKVEGQVSFNRFLDRMGDIRINEEKHGPADARVFNYEPTYILRGLTELYLDFTPID
ncbi:UNVERIFIED_CONTAM: cytochrome P450 [Williamsia faeni]